MKKRLPLAGCLYNLDGGKRQVRTVMLKDVELERMRWSVLLSTGVERKLVLVNVDSSVFCGFCVACTKKKAGK